VTQYAFDIPQKATVPRWAYLDYTKEDKFNPTFAESVGRNPEATPPATSSATSPPPTATDPSNEDGDQQEGKGGSTRNVGAIAGGVVGGLVGFAIITALFIFFLRKRRQRMRQAHIIDLDLATGAQWDTTATQNAYNPQRLYDPSDPSTFPAPVSGAGGSYTSSQTDNTPTRLGKYTGSAEI